MGGDTLGAQNDARAPFQRFAVGAGISGHAGGAAGHRLQQRQGQSLNEAGQHKDFGALQQRHAGFQVGLIAPPQHLSIAELVHQSAAEGAIADDHQSATDR